MKRLVALLWIGLLLGGLTVTPKLARADGEVYWAKRYESEAQYEASSVAIAPNGDIIVAGHYKGDLLVLRLDSEGNVRWERSYGAENWNEAYSIAVSPNGDIIVAGFTYGISTNDHFSAWLLCLDENGSPKWQKAYKVGEDNWAYAVAVAPNGDIIVAGTLKLSRYAIVLRLNTDGSVKWAMMYSSGRENRASAVAIAENGDIIVAGSTEGSNTYGYDIWVFRLDSEGNVKWGKIYGGSGDDGHSPDSDYYEKDGMDVALAPNGDILVIGEADGFHADYPYYGSWILRLDDNGDVMWHRIYEGNAHAIAVAENGDIIVSGSSLLRLSPEGDLKWSKALEGRDIEVLPNGTAILVNDSMVARFSVEDVPEYSGWEPWSDARAWVHEIDDPWEFQVNPTEVMALSAKVGISGTNARIMNISAEVETLWTYTPKGTLEVSSEPSGAEVYINGNYTGETPITVELEAGNYTVEISKEGYEEYTTNVEVNAGDTTKITAQLREKPTTTTPSETTTTTSTTTPTTTSATQTTTSSPSPSETTTTQTPSDTTSSSPKTSTEEPKGGICGPALLLALAVVPLLRRRR